MGANSSPTSEGPFGSIKRAVVARNEPFEASIEPKSSRNAWKWASREARKFSDEQSKFYGLQTAAAFAHIHSRELGFTTVSAV